MKEVTKILNLPDIVEEKTPLTVIDQKPSVPAPIQAPTQSEEDENLERDFQLVKANLEELSAKGVYALDELVELAKTSQHASVYEAIAPLIKSLSETNQGILEAYLKRKRIKEPAKNTAPPPPAGSTTNITVDKAVFTGSTADLMKKIQDDSKSNISD